MTKINKVNVILTKIERKVEMVKSEINFQIECIYNQIQREGNVDELEALKHKLIILRRMAKEYIDIINRLK